MATRAITLKQARELNAMGLKIVGPKAMALYRKTLAQILARKEA